MCVPHDTRVYIGMCECSRAFLHMRTHVCLYTSVLYWDVLSFRR